jgi:hypothetical protein
LIIFSAIILAGLPAIQAPIAAADPLCPNNQSATLDPVFAVLVQRVGDAVVGSLTTCVSRAGNTGLFNQQTSRGTLYHDLDGTVTFETSYLSPTPYQTWTLRPDGTFITPDGQQQLASSAPQPTAPSQTSTEDESTPAPTALDGFDPHRILTAPTSLPADDPAVSADAITPGRYACYAQLGGSSSGQVSRSGSAAATKQIDADGSWRDTTNGSLSARDPRNFGTWSFDGATLTLTWGSGTQDLFAPQIRTNGQPQLVEFDSDPESNLTCYLVE